jgi:V/A-type H+-transporting ATPase subunit I
MLVAMTKIRILGRRADAERVLATLHRLQAVEIADTVTDADIGLAPLSGDQPRTAERDALEQSLLQTAALLAELPSAAGTSVAARSVDVTDLAEEVQRLHSRLGSIDERLDGLRSEDLLLRSHLRPLRRLMPLVPVIAGLEVDELKLLGLATMALILNTDNPQLPEALHAALVEMLGTRFELASTDTEDGSMGCLVVFPIDAQPAVQALLGRAAVRSETLPARFEGLSLQRTVDAMRQRLDDIAQEISAAQEERRTLLLPHADQLAAHHSAVTVMLELMAAAESLAATQRTFLVEAWIPRQRVQQLQHDLGSALGNTVVVEDAATSPDDPQAPVLLHNRRLARPFESLVRFLELPRTGATDPTFLMAIFLPVMFGAMVGDIGYGIILLLLAILGRRKLAQRRTSLPEVASVLWVLLCGAGWSIVFGLLYGELFGDLGHHVLGDFALWRDRSSPGALQPLLLFAVAVGVIHIILGLGVGAWQAIRLRQPRVLLDKIGTVLALIGLFGIAGSVASRMPSTVLLPAAAATTVGLVLVMSLNGLLGIATGALDLLGRLGNILSYLRLAAVGLASAYLANVANQLGSIGPIWLGILIAAFLHALNLLLASFSPMIQALRLHYVELFGTFFLGGGRPFTPFGHQLERETVSPT